MKKTLLISGVAAFTLAAFCFFRFSAEARDTRPARPLTVPASELPRVAAEGRAVAYPGSEVTVGSDFAGVLSRVAVNEQQRVKKGQVLAEVDASEERAALAQARARITEAEASMRLAESEMARAAQLLESKVGTRQALERAERDRDAARAQRATAAAEAERLQALIKKSLITAPISGTILTKNVSAGETVQRGTPLFVIADLDRMRIEAEVDESDSERLQLGAPAKIKVDDATTLTGKIEEIPGSVSLRKVKPQDPSKPLDTRVLLVKIALDGKPLLKLGRRVEVEIAASR